jgi:DNA-binding SARP family transcriptional activator
VRRALALAGRLRAAAGIAATLALLAGLPYGLARLTGSPMPRNWPGWQQAQRFLASPLSDDAIIRALADAAWLLWAVFALSLAVELIAVTRGRPAPRLPAIAPVQALAAALVGAILMTALHAPRTGPRSAQPLHAALTSATVISAPLAPGRPAQPQEAAAAATAGAVTRDSLPAARPRVYRVVEGDDLWDIAERFLGDPEDWHQIYQLNEGKPQPDGRALTDPGLIQPGWVLLIPGPAGHGTTARPTVPARPARPHSATRPHATSPSLTPSPRSSPSASRPGQAAHAPQPAHTSRPHQVAVRLPSGALVGIAVAVMVAAALTLAAVHRRRRYRPRHAPPGSLQPEVPPLPEVIGTLRRAAREQAPGAEPDADSPGQDPYLDLYDGDAGPALVPADGPAAALAAQPEGSGLPGPRLDANPLNPGLDLSPDLDLDLDLYDSDASPAPVPGDGYSAMPGAQPARPGPEPDAAITTRPVPVPGAIPVGVRGEAEVAADIAALGGLGLAGPGAGPAARAIIASLLARVPPGQAGLTASIVIPAADAARLLPGTDPAAVPGLSVPATLEAALDEMEAAILTQARTTGALDGGDPPGPGAALVATCTPAAARRLAAVLESGRRLGAAAVLLGTWAAGTTCTVAADGTVDAVTPPSPDLDGIRLFTLSTADAAAITSVLRDAGGSLPGTDPAPPASTSGNGQLRPARSPQAPASPPAASAELPAPGAPESPAPGPPPSATASPAAPAGEQQDSEPAAPEKRLVQLRLLGELRITAGDQEVSGGLRKARELLAFLAVHPDGAGGEAISEALWPEASPDRVTGQRNLALRKAREMLRTATGLAAPMWIINASGRYRLDPALIGTDLQAFGDALDRARHATEDARLAACRTAAALYNGELAAGAGYEWAEPYAETARSRALDAWTTIAEIIQPSDPDGALSALETALSHDPYNEYLYQRIMRLQAAAGRPEAVRRTLALLETRLTDLGITPGTQTRQVAASLLGSPAPRPAADQERDAGS